ncbi:unnamed protein product [Rhizophagus irregularis]|nr:unnamed protein product [Rhizophagus irregularis]
MQKQLFSQLLQSNVLMNNFPIPRLRINKYSQREKTPIQQSISNLQQTQYQQFQSHVASQFPPKQKKPTVILQPPPPGQVHSQPPPPGLSTPQQLLTRPPEFIANKI